MTEYDYGYQPTFQVGDHVRIARLNRDAELPDGECVFAGHFPADWIGREIVITDDHEYDPDDNSWDFWDDEWVHEGALELVKPLTQEDEDAAIRSILSVWVCDERGHNPLGCDCGESG